MDLYFRVRSAVERGLTGAEERLLRESPPEPRSLLAHSLRVSRLSRRLALSEGGDPMVAALAGLLHDVGKFSGGRVLGRGEDELASAESAREIVVGCGGGEELADKVAEAIRWMYSGRYVSPEQAALHDADVLDKVGVHGLLVGAMKWALRGDDPLRFVELRASQFLTYSRNAERILLTDEGRKVAGRIVGNGEEAIVRLLEEVGELFSERFEVEEAEVEGIPVLVVARSDCGGGGRPEVILRTKRGRRGGVVLEVEEECPGEGAAPISFSFYLPII